MALTVQFYTMLSMAAMGIWLGAAVDTYSRFTPERHQFNLKTAFLDLVFWLLQALIVFYVLFKANLGEVRVYVFLAMICGYAGYQALFKGIYTHLLEGMIRFVQGLFRFLTLLLKTIIYQPIKWILHVLQRLAMIVVIAVWSVLLYLVIKPIYWILRLIGIIYLLKKGQPIVKKIKDLFKLLVKRD